MPFLFALTLFVSATLLFLVQPMVAKMVLPRLGGTPAVWTTCMVFFQAALLAGYAYAHATTKWLGSRGQVLLHIVLLFLPLFVLPLSIKGWVPPADANPIASLLLMLTLSVGMPFFVLSASAPLLQKWFAATGHWSARDPYYLYAASNLGSMLALIGYPVFFEPHLRLNATRWLDFGSQSGDWSAGYALLAVLLGVCAWVVWQASQAVRMQAVDSPVKIHSEESISALPDARRSRSTSSRASAASSQSITAARGARRGRPGSFDVNDVSKESPASTTPSLFTMVHWLALAFVPSSLMLGATTWITLDIAAIPLLWVIPLGLYLLSFIFVFARWPALMHKIVVLAAPLAILLLVFVMVAEPKGILLKIVLHLLGLFMVAMMCHGELAGTRPATRHLTVFFLLMSVGGVLGGLFNALLAPLVFPGLFEYHLAIIVACMLIPPLGQAGGVSFFAEVLKRFASRERDSKIGEFSRWLLSFLRIGEASWRGWLTGIVFDIGIALGVYFVAACFIAFFHSRSDTDNTTWLNRLPSWLAWFHEWTNTRIAKVTTSLKLNEAQVRSILMYGIPILLTYAFVTRPIRFGLCVAALFIAGGTYVGSSNEWKTLFRERSFFGVLKVEYWEPTQTYRLLHGTTTHGEQYRDGQHDFEPMTYYHETGPVGQVFEALEARLKNKNLAFIGLGCGTLACYGKSGQHVTFYDIDPAVVRISTQSGYFTYYEHCRADKEVILGDARLKIEQAEDAMYQLIVVDAFSSDAIPVHLITREAIETYFKKMKPDGVLMVHISNRYLDLEPVLGNLAQNLGYIARRMKDEDDSATGKYTSDWVVIARKKEDLGSLYTAESWKPAKTNPKVGVWTDDYSNLLSVFEWRN